jgi:hypothetical protein
MTEGKKKLSKQASKNTTLGQKKKQTAPKARNL